jgi:CRP-like cAMP-binding protein
MNSSTVDNIALAELVELFRHSLGFKSLTDHGLEEIAGLAYVKRFAKGEVIFHENEPCHFFYVVAQGLVKVSISSSSGMRITYLLADRGEPINLIGPFTGSPRLLFAEAMEDAAVVCIPREDFVSFVFEHSDVIIDIFSILGQAIDSANRRIIDMVEMRVEQRLFKVLHTLYEKFGATLKFTSSELAELAGTTTESTLRVMGRLRESGIIKTGRGEISVIKPTLLKSSASDTLWV